MHVCSFHFVQSDYKEIINGIRKCLKKEAFPSVFNFTSPRKIKLRRKSIIRESQDRPVKDRPRPEPETSTSNSVSLSLIVSCQLMVVFLLLNYILYF